MRAYEKRVKLFPLPLSVLVKVLSCPPGSYLRVGVPWPENAAITAVDYCFTDDVFLCRVEHPSFPVVPEAQTIPRGETVRLECFIVSREADASNKQAVFEASVNAYRRLHSTGQPNATVCGTGGGGSSGNGELATVTVGGTGGRSDGTPQGRVGNGAAGLEPYPAEAATPGESEDDARKRAEMQFFRGK